MPELVPFGLFDLYKYTMLVCIVNGKHNIGFTCV